MTQQCLKADLGVSWYSQSSHWQPTSDRMVPTSVEMFEIVNVSRSSLDGTRKIAILDIGTAVARPHVQSEQRPEAFQMQFW